MKKLLKIVAVALAAVGVMAMTSFAGEFIQHSDGRTYYNTGDWGSYNGWHWIMRTDGLARCYYFDDGYIWGSPYTPDGYRINEQGEWMENGQVVTKSAFEAGMGRETNWGAFTGNYNIRALQDSSGNVTNFGPGEWPIRVDSGTSGFNLVWNDGTRQWYYPENYQYSFKCDDGTLIDVIDENNFRIIDVNGSVSTVTR